MLTFVTVLHAERPRDGDTTEMTMTFFADRANDALLERGAATDPDNPFLIGSYMRAQCALGFDAWLFGVEQLSTMQSASLGLIKSGRIRRSLTINSLPQLSGDSPFWTGIEAFCTDRGITDLELATFASPESVIPRLKGEIERIQRTEFILSLGGRDVVAELSKHHRERVKKGRKNGLTIRRTRSDEALDAHIGLRAHSMGRREARGEKVPHDFARESAARFLESGAGELYQAMLHDEIVSSLLILRSASGAYFESAGTSSSGMSIGASHFLLVETARALQTDGVVTFFLGGARRSEEGLYSYKAGFGSVAIDTESVSAYVGGRWRRGVSEVVESAQKAISRRTRRKSTVPDRAD